MDNDLKDRFDAADGALTFGEGSLESVIETANRRTRRTQVGGSLAAIVLVAVVGFFALQLLMPDAGTVITDVTNEDSEGDAQEAALGTAELSANDFVYVGSFTTPGTADGTGFEFGGDAIAFNPANNSLFITGRRINPEVAEITIPNAAPHEGLRSDLVEAEIIQGFGDVTGGRAAEQIGSVDVGGQDDYRINGLEVVDGVDGPRLVWTATQYQNAGVSELPGHGHSSLDLAEPDVAGPWKLENALAEQSAGYVFDVPQDFADSYLGGRGLLGGYLAEVRGFTSQGAPFFAFDTPDSGEPEARVLALELVNYQFPDEQVSQFSATMSATGADWVNTPDGRSAILTAGNSMPLDSEEICTFGTETDVDAHAPQLRLYDPADLAAVAVGDAQAHEVEPYLIIDLGEHLIPVCGAQLSGVAFDGDTNRLFIVQSDVTATERGFDARPVIHVFTVG